MPEPDMPPESGTNAALQQTPPQVPAPQPGGEPPLTPDDLHAFGQLVSLEQDDVRRQTEKLDRDEADLEAGRVEPELGKHRVHGDESDLDEVKARHGPWSLLATLTGRQAVVLWVGLTLLFFLLLLAVVNGLGQGQNTEPQANAPAGQAQQPAGGQPAGGAGAAQPGGAVGGGQQPGGDQGSGVAQPGGEQPGGAIPANCLVPGDKITITLENSEWTETSDQTIGGYQIFLTNGTDKQICVLEHFTSQNSRNDPANRPPNAWASECNWFAGSGESGGQDAHPLAGAEFWQGEHASECYYDYPDKIVAVYYDNCPAILKAKLDGMPTDQRGTILDPYAWDLPVFGRAQGFSCH